MAIPIFKQTYDSVQAKTMELQAAYERAAEEVVQQMARSIQEARQGTDGKITTVFQRCIMQEAASVRRRIAHRAGDPNADKFGERRNTPAAVQHGYYSHTALIGKYVEYRAVMEPIFGEYTGPVTDTTSEIETRFTCRVITQAECKPEDPGLTKLEQDKIRRLPPNQVEYGTLKVLHDFHRPFYDSERVRQSVKEFLLLRSQCEEPDCQCPSVCLLGSMQMRVKGQWISLSEQITNQQKHLDGCTRSLRGKSIGPIVVMHQDIFLQIAMLQIIEATFVNCVRSVAVRPLPRDAVVHNIARFTFLFSHTMPFLRGSAALSEWVQTALWRVAGYHRHYQGLADFDAFTARTLGEFISRYERCLVLTSLEPPPPVAGGAAAAASVATLPSLEGAAEEARLAPAAVDGVIGAAGPLAATTAT